MLRAITLVVLTLLSMPLAVALDEGWPREIETARGLVTIYQPQIESFADNRLESRAAVSVKAEGGEPTFGAVWLSARTETDRDARVELPEPFSGIGEDSPNGAVLSAVAGTPQAREAVLDASVPQTSAIRLDAEAPEIEYDGDPEFKPVEDVSEVLYAINTPESVFKVGQRYFACVQAVWYESAAATGPWKVASEIPSSIYDIPTSNPNHSVTYVKVYDVTPQVVYVGYTPGYVGSYYYGGYRKTNININTGDINIGGGSGNRPENKARNADVARATDRQQSQTSDPANNVYSDRDGNVYRRNDNGSWVQRAGGQWKNAENLDRAGSRPSGGAQSRPSTGAESRPSTGPGSRPSYGSGSATRPQLERDHSSRQRGSQRSNNYNRSYGGGGSRGGSRGGGGRRR